MMEENPLDDVGTPREVLDRMEMDKKASIDDSNVFSSKRLREGLDDGGDEGPDSDSSDDESDMDDEINNNEINNEE